MEELVSVVNAKDGVAWVEKERQTQCGGCSVRHGCGTATLSKVLGVRRSRIRVIAPFSVNSGDKVLISLKESSLLKASFVSYMLPLFGLFLGALLGQLIFAPIFGSEGIVVILAIVGLAIALLWLRRFSLKIKEDPNYHPVITRIVEPVEPIAVSHCLTR